MRILGLDVGEKRIGVAKVDSNTRIAVPIGFVQVDGSEWQEITRLARLIMLIFLSWGYQGVTRGTKPLSRCTLEILRKLWSEKYQAPKSDFKMSL